MSASPKIQRSDFAGRFLIVDGHAYAYRAFHAIRGLRAPDGRPTNAIFGFVKMLAKMEEALHPTHWMVVWDGGLSAERMNLLPEYKAHRPAMPEDLRPQLDEMTAWLEACDIGSFCRAGVEADDYIACLARRGAAAGMEVIIASSDKDFMQLVSPRVGLLLPHDKTETIWTDEQVRAKAGVEPSQIVDWLSLTGDAVDNISGVPGVGPKTAADLLKQFGSVEEMYGRLGEVKSERLRQALEGSRDHVCRNREMVRLRDDLQGEFDPAKLAVRPPDASRLRELYARWGFKGLLGALPQAAHESQPALI
ncbi:MAG: flap endonuclease [Verrucomicrobia bacterium]|nr:flap endonuclease [Verrucomicrobiota bacterium]MDE3099224.1 flap endonuclease [Verrucomicrobiota bacterium]